MLVKCPEGCHLPGVQGKLGAQNEPNEYTQDWQIESESSEYSHGWNGKAGDGLKRLGNDWKWKGEGGVNPGDDSLGPGSPRRKFRFPSRLPSKETGKGNPTPKREKNTRGDKGKQILHTRVAVTSTLKRLNAGFKLLEENQTKHITKEWRKKNHFKHTMHSKEKRNQTTQSDKDDLRTIKTQSKILIKEAYPKWQQEATNGHADNAWSEMKSWSETKQRKQHSHEEYSQRTTNLQS